MKNKGFTLVELLAVIVILAVILVIAVPQIMDTIKQSKEASFISSAKLILNQVEKKVMENNILDKIDNIDCEEITKLNNEDYQSCVVGIVEGNASIILRGKGKFNNMVVKGEKNNIQITYKEDAPVFDCTYNGELTQGAEFIQGQFTYRYKQRKFFTPQMWNTLWNNMDIDGWSVALTDITSTDPVSGNICTTINNKPVVDMSYMFFKSNAKSIDLSGFNTSEIINMEGLFFVSKTNIIDFGELDTSNVTDMSQMFLNCNNVATLDLSSFDTTKVTNMKAMFTAKNLKRVYARTEADANKFNTLAKIPNTIEVIIK